MNRRKISARRWRCLAVRRRYARSAGFTVLELLVAVLIIGILFTFTLPLWQNLLTTQRLNIAREQVFQTMREAQKQANAQNRVWQASFRDGLDGTLQMAVHVPNALPQTIVWESLTIRAKIDVPATTLRSRNGIYRIQFGPQGGANGQIGRLTVKGDRHEMPKRCVFVSTLLGTLRKAADNRCLS